MITAISENFSWKPLYKMPQNWKFDLFMDTLLWIPFSNLALLERADSQIACGPAYKLPARPVCGFVSFFPEEQAKSTILANPPASYRSLSGPPGPNPKEV